MVSIDDELINALIPRDQHSKIAKDAPIKKIVGPKIISYETEVNIGQKRTADILVTVQGRSKHHRVVVEVENDRKFDVGEILRKIKKDKPYPVIVIIPKEFERFAWRFQNSGMNVWYWTATCKWLCRKCNSITKSTSSMAPLKCSHCQKGNPRDLRFKGIEDEKFEEANNNPTLTYKAEMEVSTAKVPW